MQNKETLAGSWNKNDEYCGYIDYFPLAKGLGQFFFENILQRWKREGKKYFVGKWKGHYREKSPNGKKFGSQRKELNKIRPNAAKGQILTHPLTAQKCGTFERNLPANTFFVKVEIKMS